MNMDEANLRVTIEALASELRATELSLAQWQAHAGRLHAQLRAVRRSPDDSLGAPRLLAGQTLPSRAREWSTSSTASIASLRSMGSLRSVRSIPASTSSAQPPPPPPATSAGALPSFLSREFWDPKEAQAARRRTAAAITMQRWLRGHHQRERYSAAVAFYAIVNGTVELRSGRESVPAYTLTVVRGGQCWQVSHRFSDWLELDRQLSSQLPATVARPYVPSRYPFRSARLTTHRQFALNK